ncbi:MAG: SLC13 family permease [Pseudomonadota bacterium]
MIEFDLQMLAVVFLIVATITLFITEVVSIDVAALSILIALGLLTLIPGFEGLLAPGDLFKGFSSNAVISIMAIMIIGEALDRVGVMRWVANAILRFAGRTETRLTTLVCSTVAVISSFMQNVGAAALFIPVVSRLSAQTEIPITRLLMPMGFCAIMGGTLTMVGSSPLILLNDLTSELNRNLNEGTQLPELDLFAVTPIGICLVVTGIIYFVVIGRRLLPQTTREHAFGVTRVADRIKNAYLLNPEIFIAAIPTGHRFIAKSVGEIENECDVHIIAVIERGKPEWSPTRDTLVTQGCEIGVVGSEDGLTILREREGFKLVCATDHTRDYFPQEIAGFSEVVIPAESKLVGLSIGDIWLRRNYHLAGLGINRGTEVFSRGVRHIEFQPGDTLLTFSTHDAFADLQKNRDFIPITPGREVDIDQSGKLPIALALFAISIVLIIFSDLMLSLCLWVGAIGMVLFRILSMEQAYQAISWKTIFLLAGLMPLGIAVETSGTAAWLAEHLTVVLVAVPPIVVQAALALVATFFTLVMSNVGATVLLVPVAVNLALALNADPMIFALIIALSTSNSFLIPTHQVNVLIMGPGGYRVVDFLKSGGLITVLFIVVELAALNFFFL